MRVHVRGEAHAGPSLQGPATTFLPCHPYEGRVLIIIARVLVRSYPRIDPYRSEIWTCLQIVRLKAAPVVQVSMPGSC